MNEFAQVSYALQRQKAAVERTLAASSPEETTVALRWADAWHRLVQARLDRAELAHRQHQPSRYFDYKRNRLLH
ncbi:hypothetical protein [Pseudoduganella rhizocola]|jgi:hypothetical protein|uniref:hypothetical protein n=1 Tax=Pseudoduganella rhizocola TaxID=3382643 RepID=UPI0038B559C7